MIVIHNVAFSEQRCSSGAFLTIILAHLLPFAFRENSDRFPSEINGEQVDL